MASWPPKKNTAFTVTFPIYDNDGDLVSGAAALDSEVSIDGGTFTDTGTEATELATSSGIYKLPLTTAEMNGDIIATLTKTSTSNAKSAVNVMYTATRQIDDLAYPATSGRSLLVDTSGYTTAASVTGAVGSVTGNVGGNVTGSIGSVATGGIVAVSFAAGAIDATAAPNLDAAVTTRSSHGAGDVWAVDATTQQTQGTFGQAIGDPVLDTDTIWGLANTNLDAAVSSRSSHSAADVWAVATRNLTALGFALASSDLSAGTIDANALAADAGNEIADAILGRDVGNIEATAALHSLATAILKAVSKIEDAAGTLKVYRTDGTTLHMSQTIGTDASLDPVDSLTVGV